MERRDCRHSRHPCVELFGVCRWHTCSYGRIMGRSLSSRGNQRHPKCAGHLSRPMAFIPEGPRGNAVGAHPLKKRLPIIPRRNPGASVEHYSRRLAPPVKGLAPESRKCFIGRAQDGERGPKKCWCARSIKPSEGSRSRLRRTRWGYGNCMWANQELGRHGCDERVDRYGCWEMLRSSCIDHEACEARNVSVTRHTSK